MTCFWRSFKYIRSAAHRGLAADYCRSRMVVGDLRIGKMPSFDFVIVHVCRMCARFRRMSRRRHFMRQI